MVLRVHNIGGWLPCRSGEAFKLRANKRRVIRIDFNAEADAAVHLVEPGGEVTFLAAFKGMQTVEFVAGSDAASEDAELLVSVTSEATVWYRTIDGDIEHYSSSAVSFVKVATRRTRNPELELMMYKQEQNMRRREALLAEQIAEMRARIEAAREAPVVERDEGPANDNAPPADEASADTAAAERAAGNDGGGAARKGARKSPASGTGGEGADA